MRALLKKEGTLAAAPLTYIFLAFAILTLVPGYPILVGGFFICLGIFYSFQFSREYNDILYTALLPVEKRDVVKAKFTFVMAVQAAGFLFSAVFALVRLTALKNAKVYAENPLLSANLIYLGGLLIIFGLFQLIFLSGFFKTAYYFGKPFILFCIAAMLIIGLMETLIHIPGLLWLNGVDGNSLVRQLPVFLLCLVFYLAGSVFSLKKSQNRFEQIDL